MTVTHTLARCLGFISLVFVLMAAPYLAAAQHLADYVRVTPRPAWALPVYMLAATPDFEGGNRAAPFAISHPKNILQIREYIVDDRYSFDERKRSVEMDSIHFSYDDTYAEGVFAKIISGAVNRTIFRPRISRPTWPKSTSFRIGATQQLPFSSTKMTADRRRQFRQSRYYGSAGFFLLALLSRLSIWRCDQNVVSAW